MATSSAKTIRMTPLQRLTVRPIEDPAKQAALDERLKRAQAAISGDSTPTGVARVQADWENSTNPVAGNRKALEGQGFRRSRPSRRKRRG